VSGEDSEEDLKVYCVCNKVKEGGREGAASECSHSRSCPTAMLPSLDDGVLGASAGGWVGGGVGMNR
jgi:hypothetical protein